MLESVVLAVVIICVVLYIAGGVALYWILKRSGIKKVDSIDVSSFSGTYTNNLFQVIFVVGPKKFGEYVEDPAARRVHKMARFSWQCFVASVIALILIRSL